MLPAKRPTSHCFPSVYSKFRNSHIRYCDTRDGSRNNVCPFEIGNPRLVSVRFAQEAHIRRRISMSA